MTLFFVAVDRIVLLLLFVKPESLCVSDYHTFELDDQCNVALIVIVLQRPLKFETSSRCSPRVRKICPGFFYPLISESWCNHAIASLALDEGCNVATFV